MKFAVRFVLVLFITFLSTPTVVSLIENSCDTTLFYSMSEEEQVHKEIKEVKAELKSATFGLAFISSGKTSGIISENASRHDNISAVIFSPPPNV